jgi:hypothetical protein
MSLQAILDGMAGGINRNFCVKKKPMQWFVINHAEELHDMKKLPIEFQYAIAIHPSRFSTLESLLNEGHGIALGRQQRIPADVVCAVAHIAGTHHGALYPWLEDLACKQTIPRWSESDFDEASAQGINLKEQAKIIINHIKSGVQVKLLQSPTGCTGSAYDSLVRAMEHDLQKVHSLKVAHSLCGEHLGRSRDFNLLFILSLVLFAPIAHALELLFMGLGKFAAAILPGLYHESLRLKQSYSLGAASWQLADNIKARWPEIIVMVVAGALVQITQNLGYPAVAGICFAVASGAIFTGTELRRLKKARLVHQILSENGKLSMSSKTAWLKLYYGPIWWAHGLSMILSLICSMVIFAFFTPWLRNGWLLSITAISPMLFFELLLWLWRLTLDYRFGAKVKAMLSNTIIA